MITIAITVLMCIAGLAWTGSLAHLGYRMRARYYISGYMDAEFGALRLAWQFAEQVNWSVVAIFVLWILSEFFGG